MLMITKVVAVSVAAVVMGGTPVPGSDPAGSSLSASSIAVAQPDISPARPSCPSGCNVWRMISDGR